MDLLTVMERFPDQEACITHLEKIRWGDTPKCPHCESEDDDKVGRGCVKFLSQYDSGTHIKFSSIEV